jgi:hypothetical protein
MTDDTIKKEDRIRTIVDECSHSYLDPDFLIVPNKNLVPYLSQNLRLVEDVSNQKDTLWLV